MLAVFGLSCGKKGDPEPPLLPIPHATDDLIVAQRGGELLLDFAFPRTTAAGMPLPALERVEVYRMVRPALPAPPADEADDEAATGDDQYLAPPVDQREFEAAATVAVTLRGDEIAAAVRGDRLALSLPQEPPPPAPEAHYFAVRTVAEGDYPSALSNRVSIVPEPPPPAPHDLDVTPRADGVEIAWQIAEPPAGAATPIGFNVYRRAATERDFGPPLRRIGPSQGSYLDLSARYDQRYVYAVTAIARPRPLIESAIAAAREVDYRDRFPPPPPEGLVALADEGSVRLVWDPSHAADLAGYAVYRRAGEGPWRRLTAEPLAEAGYADPAVEAGAVYRYRVTALDRLGNESEPGAEASAVGR